MGGAVQRCVPDADHAYYLLLTMAMNYALWLWLCLMQIIATSGAIVVYLPVGERSVLIWVGVVRV